MKVFQVNGSSLSLALFTDVTNSKELLTLMQGGPLEPEVAFLNAALMPDIFPILAAAQKSLLAKSREALTTRTLHSKLVFNYSGSNHISDSLKRRGIPDGCTYVLVAIFNASSEEILYSMQHYKITAAELGILSLLDAITCRIVARDAM